jgi:uncharacterized protein YxjI
MQTLVSTVYLLLIGFPEVIGWTTSTKYQSKHSASSRHMNIFQDFGDMLTGGRLAETTQLPYDPPISSSLSLSSKTRILAIQERPISFTGEDFDVVDAESNSDFCKVRGAMLHLPGKDKMRIYVDEKVAASLERKWIAMSPTYDIFRGDNGQKLGWIEKEIVAFQDTFDVYLEGEGGALGPLFKPPPAFKLEGDFLDRNFCMKNCQGQVVAKISKDWIIQFDEFNHYQVQISQGMDAVLVVACLCAIDEEFDQEHRAAK